MSRSGLTLVACAALAIGALGGAFTGAHLVTCAPAEIEEPGERIVTITTSEIDDDRLVELKADVIEAEPLLGNVDGRVTSSRCEPGEAFTSGDLLGSVDGLPVLLLATDVPLWRELRAGDRGDDLNRFSTSAQVWASMCPPQAESIGRRRWRFGSGSGRTSGAATPNSFLPLRSVVWSPDSQLTVASCELRGGATVTGGMEVLTPTSEFSKSSEICNDHAELARR